MLETLTIKNFGLIDTLSIDFSDGFNVFTGETGAGKSILIDALRYALGDKLSLESIRDKTKNCTVEASFHLKNNKWKDHPVLSEYIEDNTLIITRTYTHDGKSKNKVNGLNVTVSTLKNIGDNLVDLHGPHDHQLLFSQNYHIKMLDRLCAIDSLKQQYQTEYAEYQDLKLKLRSLHELAQNSAAQLDLLSHQIHELEQVPLDEKNYADIKDKISRINNMEKLFESSNNIISLISNEQAGLSPLLEQAFSSLKDLNKVDESTSNLTEILEKVQEDIYSIQGELSEYVDKLSFEPDQAQEINRKYDIYYEILRKYGPEIEDAKSYYEKTKEKHNTIVDLEHNDKDIRKKIKDIQTKTDKTAENISLIRKKCAKTLSKTIETELKQLGIENVTFECKILPVELNKNGKDDVVFYISPNKGEEPKPLAKIVSSGEAARVMLALKKALTKADPIPVLIFDEIDAQIGGRLGSVTGKKLKELSSDRQIILITHLPQIASFSDTHFKVLKVVKNDRTYTTVDSLTKENIIQELAHMMSGQPDSKIAIKHAKDMLSSATNH